MKKLRLEMLVRSYGLFVYRCM